MSGFLEKIGEKIVESAAIPEGGNVTFINPYSYLILRSNQEVLDCIPNIAVDGFLLVAMLRLVGIRTQRASFDFTSLARPVLARASQRGQEVYFVGASEDDVSAFAAKITAKFPKLLIAGYRSGYFSCEKEYRNEIERIVNASPDIVVVGMGTPRQEKLLCDLAQAGWRGQGFTCGGFFHQTASSDGIKYYPEWMNKWNLRWLYRVWDEPKLFIRYGVQYPRFLLIFLLDVYRARVSRA